MLFKVSFVNQGELFEVYVRKIYQSDMFGFVTLEEFDFESKNVVVDPSEERLKSEFKNVDRCYIPMHNVVRIDEVKKPGTAKIVDIGEKVAQLPAALYGTPGKKPDTL